MNLLFTFLLLFSATLADEKAVISGNNKFAPAVYQLLTKIETGNFLLCPLSAEIVLALLQSGCKGETGQQLRDGLFLPDNPTEIESGFQSLLSKLNTSNQYIFHYANKIYVQKNYIINESFQNTATQKYLAAIEGMDFSKNVEAAKIINEWVEQQTNNKIKNLIDADSLDSSTALVLINALYFKGNWSIPFEVRNTRPRNFYKTRTEIIQVDTLHLESKNFRYYESKCLKAQFLELPFKGKNASMIIALPNDIDGLPRLEKQIDRVLACNCFLKSQNLNVALPKFLIETKIDFNDILKSLGVTNIFSDSKADLSGIAGQPGDLKVSQVVQKTFINVTEVGVEAAAATAVGVVLTSVGVPATKSFVADHPFIFSIKIEEIVVFVGRVLNPELNG